MVVNSQTIQILLEKKLRNLVTNEILFTLNVFFSSPKDNHLIVNLSISKHN